MADKIELTDVIRLTWGFGDHEHPVFAPDGKRLAYYAGEYGYLQLYVVGADGHGARPLTCARGNHTQPAWSHDGRWVYYRHQPAADRPWEIWRVEVEAPENKQRVLADGTVSFKHPSPSPDGAQLAWFSDQGTPNNFHLFKAPLAGDRLGPARQLTADPDRNDCHPTWSPDAGWLTFHAYLGAVDASSSHIFVCDAEGGKLRQLSSGAGFHKHPFFVGRDLVIHHTEEPDGLRYVVLRKVADGAVAAKLTSGKKNDKHPSVHVPARGPTKVCFSSKKRGTEHDREREASYDVFAGTLAGVRVRR